MMRYYVTGKRFEENTVTAEEKVEIFVGKSGSCRLFDGACRVETVWEGDGDNAAAGKLEYHFTQDSKGCVQLGLEAVREDWHRENYVFMPAAVYDGNRMESVRTAYPPYCGDSRMGEHAKHGVITDIWHLDKDGGNSDIQLLAGDMSTPAMGFYDGGEQEGFLLYGTHREAECYTGFTVREDTDKKEAAFLLTLPGVREGRTYFFGEKADGSGFFPDGHAVSRETGKCFAAGEEGSLPFYICCFPAGRLIDFFAWFNENRFCLETGGQENVLPFSAAYEVIRDKVKRENFCEEGYYAVGTNHSMPQQCWQAGWVGGGMNYYPFLQAESGKTYENSLSTFRFILDYLLLPSGWFCGLYGNGILYGDNFKLDSPGDILLVRKDADLLYYLLRQSQLLEEKGHLRPMDKRKIERQANAFWRLFEKFGQLGQFIDTNTEEILISDTACGAAAAGAMALAGNIYGNTDYLKTAEKLGDLYYREYVEKGIINGGPGEICQACDSESAFAMLESFVQLYESTGDRKWLDCAEDTFEIAITWAVSYDFYFPKDSTAAKRRSHTLGTVFANAQNKHSAPGICTMSGSVLLKLYHYTGKTIYLDWMGRISHSVPQYVSVKGREVFTLEGKYLPEGYMNERVQTSDWEGKEAVGEFLYGSNWPEVTMLLTYAEVPGIYIDETRKLVRCFDHVECSVQTWEEDGVTLLLKNTTAYPAKVTVLKDDGRFFENRPHNYFSLMEAVEIGAGSETEYRISF